MANQAPIRGRHALWREPLAGRARRHGLCSPSTDRPPPTIGLRALPAAVRSEGHRQVASSAFRQPPKPIRAHTKAASGGADLPLDAFEHFFLESGIVPAFVAADLA